MPVKGYFNELCTDKNYGTKLAMGIGWLSLAKYLGGFMRSIILFIFLLGSIFIFKFESMSKPVSWLKDGKVLSPFEFHNTKLLVDEQLGQIERENLSSLEKLGAYFTGRESYIIKKGAKLSLVLKPECMLKENPPINFHPNLEVVSAKKESPKLRPLKSMVLSFGESVSSAELRSWANTEECVLGLANRRIAYASSSFSDPLMNKQTHWSGMQSNQSYERLENLESYLKSEVIIAVIDSGIELSHPDLKPNLWINYNELQGNEGLDDDGNGYVDDKYGYDFASKIPDPSHKHSFDHGTHVAGLAAAAGGNDFGGRGIISEKVKIMPLNVTGKYNGALSEDIEEAIYYAVHNGANVINISFGSPGKAAAVANAITYAVNNGLVVVSSVGNGGNSLDEEFYFPGSYGVSIPGLIAVGAYEVNSGALCGISNFSNFYVEVAAPGCDVNNPKQGLYSTKRGASFGYRKGTSMAAPIVSGGAALLYSYVNTNGYSNQNVPMEIERALTAQMPKSNSLYDFVKDGSSFQMDMLLELMPLTQ